ncbi:MAG: DUF4129 domain-containing transglutaminase family protein [Sphingomonadaceae bacterium]
MMRLTRGPQEGWSALLLLLAVVLCPAISLAEAGWVDGLAVIPWLALASALLGFILAKLPVRGPVAHLFATEIGLIGLGFYFAAMGSGRDWEERFLWLGGRIWAWLEVVFGGGMGNDNLLFTLLMAVLVWFLGYASAWFTFRRHGVWPPVVACASVLLLNLSYGAPNQVTSLIVQLMASLLLLIRITLYQKERDWARADSEYQGGLVRSSLWGSTLLSGALLAFVWVLPIGSVNAAVAENWYQITGPWQGLQVEFDRLFASIGSSSGKVEGNRFSKALALKGAIELGTEPVMVVSSPLPEYWAAQSYDEYTGHGWISSADQSTRLDANDQRLAATSSYSGRLDVEQRFKLLAGRTSTVFAATSPVKLSLAVYADHFGDLEQVGALRSTIPLRSGQQYAVISSVSVATVERLRSAGTEYPEWTGRYLALPRNSLRRVASLARRITSGTSNPYDAAVALEDYLRGFRYEIKVATPPPERDAVDWFLFTAKEGYCDYFASAMAVMARSIGIPARVVSGYNTGTLNERSSLYEVRQENAHSWPELFFPRYGWVRFEPTPSQPVPERFELTLDRPESADLTMEDGSPWDLEIAPTDREKLLYSDSFDLGIETGAGDTRSSETSSVEVPRPVMPLAVGGVLLGAWGIWRVLLSRLSPSGRAYLQMYWVAGLLGWRLRPSYTPGEYARVLGRAAAALEPEVEAVADSYAEATYGRPEPATEKKAERSWRRIRWRLPLELLKRAVGRRLPAFRRWRSDEG